MDSEIQFGELNQQDPTPQLRPDENQHFAVGACGEIEVDELAIFIDLDAMRDMEAHARTNTSVELGGVMLGQQCVDDRGRPFVLISDSLRAEHYEATKGSFKFTHETWEQISRQREQFPDELQMVGWYHTHPDWGVFLSGMDLFICDHFFNRPLDVALVIDPCGHDRGWFQWTDDKPSKVRQTKGFYLMSTRFRREEVEFFADVYSEPGRIPTDPRYVSQMGGSPVQPIVNINDQRTPIQNIAIMGMLTMQFLVLAVIALRLLVPASGESAGPKDRLSVVEAQLKGLSQAEQFQVRDEAYQEILAAITASTPDNNIVVGEYVRLREQNNKLNDQVEGQLALLTKTRVQRDSALQLKDSAQKELTKVKKGLDDANKEILALKASAPTTANGEDESAAKPWIKRWTTWLMFGCAAVVLLMGGAIAGYSLRRVDAEREYNEDIDGIEHEHEKIELPNVDPPA